MVTRFLAAIAFVGAVVAFSLAGGPTGPADAGTEPPIDRPPVTVSEFLPQDANLSDCIGLVEKPGCGSEARGGWPQFAIFGAIVVGLGIIIWRITSGLRANRAVASDSTTEHPERPQPPSTPPGRRTP